MFAVIVQVMGVAPPLGGGVTVACTSKRASLVIVSVGVAVTVAEVVCEVPVAAAYATVALSVV